ncbi:hypothetical protein PTKIN_Ptkin07bG0302300 [Pterospermum kingtungense]
MEIKEEEGGVIVVGRAEIDTRPPFRSVKEAVVLFGEKVGEIYGNKLKEMKAQGGESTGQGQSKFAALTTELEETKQNLQKAKEEGNLMTYRIKTLRDELEQTHKELQQLKVKEFQKQRSDDPDIEDLKFIENATEIGTTMTPPPPPNEEPEEFQKKRYVKFASPPSLAHVIVNKEDKKLQESPSPNSVKKVRRKTLVPIIGWLFSKKKRNQEGHHDQYPIRANEFQRDH